MPHKATGKLRRLGRVNNVHASSIMLICHHNLLVFLAILLRVVQAGSSDSLNSTDGDRLVLSFEAVANLIWKSAHAIFLSQFGTCTASSPEEAQLFLTTFGIRSLLRCICLSNVNLSQLRWLRCCSNKLDETVALKSHLKKAKRTKTVPLTAKGLPKMLKQMRKSGISKLKPRLERSLFRAVEHRQGGPAECRVASLARLLISVGH